MKILYENFVVGSTITASTGVTGYSFTDALNDTRLSRVARTSGKTDEWIKFNLGSAKDISEVCLIDHNLSATATITLQANASDVWTSPSFELVLTSDTVIYQNFPTETYQFWRLSIQDTSNTYSYLQFSFIFLGGALTMPGMETGQIIPLKSNSISSKSYSGQLYGDRNIILKSAKINFPIIEHSEKQAIDIFFNYVDVVKPFVLLIWEDDLNIESPIYCALTSGLEWSRVANSQGVLWSLSLSFEECR
jgi:hypothetical protein